MHIFILRQCPFAMEKSRAFHYSCIRQSFTLVAFYMLCHCHIMHAFVAPFYSIIISLVLHGIVNLVHGYEATRVNIQC